MRVICHKFTPNSSNIVSFRPQKRVCGTAHLKKTTITMTEQLEQRVVRAVELFKQGFNCSQSVTAAFAPLYGISEEQALRMSASFGGGIGRMRQTCGAACGMFLLAGLDCGSTDPGDREGKSHNYAVVQRLARVYSDETGSLICAELLGLQQPEGTPQAEARTAAYYKKRPCAELVRLAATIYANYLTEKETEK